jgi:hypothetical protein
LAKLLGIKYTVDDADYFWSSKKITEFKKKILKLSHLTAIKKKKKTNTLNDKEAFLSAKSWIFTIAILWGRILQNLEKTYGKKIMFIKMETHGKFESYLVVSSDIDLESAIRCAYDLGSRYCSTYILPNGIN